MKGLLLYSSVMCCCGVVVNAESFHQISWAASPVICSHFSIRIILTNNQMGQHCFIVVQLLGV